MSEKASEERRRVLEANSKLNKKKTKFGYFMNGPRIIIQGYDEYYKY